MKLHTYFRSSASFRVRIALNLKGLKPEQTAVNLPRNEHSQPAFKAVNPIGLVPALEDEGHVLAQSLAIIEYLDEKHPEPRLLPSDPFERAYVRAVAELIACEIHPLNNLRVLRYVKRHYDQDDEGINKWYRDWIRDGFAMLEAFIVAQRLHGSYMLREQVTIADCCLVPQVSNAQRYNCDLSPYPVTMAIYERCRKLQPFIDAEPSRQPDAT